MDDDTFQEIAERYPFLEMLAEADGRLARREIESRRGLSKSSVHRIVTSLQDTGLLDESDGGVALTPLGRTVYRETRDHRSSLEAAEQLAAFVEHLPLRERGLGLDDLGDARITHATEERPMAPLLRLAEVTESSDAIRVLTNTVAPQSFDIGRERILSGDLEAHLVLDESAASTLVEMEWYSESIRQDLERDRLSIDVASEPVPYQLGVMDDTVCLGADGTDGMPIGLLETEHDEVRAWALDEFAAYREDARSIDEVFEL